jgi:hypothetical protein
MFNIVHINSINFIFILILHFFRPGRGVQRYVIKFVIDLRQVGGFLRLLQFHPPIILTATK